MNFLILIFIDCIQSSKMIQFMNLIPSKFLEMKTCVLLSESQHFTHDLCLPIVPHIVTDRTPLAIDVHLHQTLVVVSSSHETDKYVTFINDDWRWSHHS